MRIVDFEMDGVKVKLASMNWATAEKFVEQGAELLRNGDTKADKWLERTLTTVCISMVSAGADANECLPSKLKEEHDMPTINAMYFRILEISGLAVKQGEAKAASASQT